MQALLEPRLRIKARQHLNPNRNPHPHPNPNPSHDPNPNPSHDPNPHPHPSPNQARQLARLSASGQLVIFMGSGMSKTAGLPSWSELLAEIATSVGSFLTPPTHERHTI